MIGIVTLPITWPCLLFFLIEKCTSGGKRSYSPVSQQPATDAKDTDSPPWRDVRDILTGNVSLHSKTLYNDRSSSWAILQLVILSLTQPIFKFIQSRWNPISLFWSCCFRNNQFKVHPNMTKSINVNCNAWLYNGTDVLWAAVLEEMWARVEADYGKFTVRFHRFLISISGESKHDDRKVKESKRKTALLMLVIKFVSYFVLAVLITIFFDDIIKFSEDKLPNVSNLILPASMYTVPAVPLLKDSVKLFLQLIGKSKGAQIFEEAQALSKHKRFDFNEKTGFMGIVKIEVEFLYDLLITVQIVDRIHQVLRPGRLNIMLDDLDRCDPKTIMDMLQAAMLLLLIDAPVTCWIPIDSQVIVASIEKILGKEFLEKGIDGYSFLEKIIQLPFCIPDLDSHQKEAFLEKIFEKGELSPRRLYERLQYLDEKADLKEFKDLLPTNSKRTLKKDDVVLPEELVPALEKMLEVVPSILNHNEDIETCFDSPKKVLQKVKDRFSSNQALGGKLEEEFLHFISVGIQELLDRSSSRLKKEGDSLTPKSPQDRATETPFTNVAPDDAHVETPDASSSDVVDITSSPSSPIPASNHDHSSLSAPANGDMEVLGTSGSDLGVAFSTSLIPASNADDEESTPSSGPDVLTQHTSPPIPSASNADDVETLAEPPNLASKDDNRDFSAGIDITNSSLSPTASGDEKTRVATPGSGLSPKIPPPTGPPELETRSSLDEGATDTLSSFDNLQWYNKIYHPIMDPLERSWFKKYADCLVGKPRKMKRILNSYMVSRIVAKKLRPNLARQNEFREKLLKLVILFEQWPYRMAWFLVIVENIQQERLLQDQDRSIVSHNPIGDTLTNIISRLAGVPDKDIMDLPLVHVYHLLVQSLIHSPETASIQLQRDSDPQVFEILLAESVTPLKLKDVASSSSGYDSALQSTVRPYLFNLQMHMTDMIQNYVDNCLLHLVENKSKKMSYGVYQKKPDFFNQEYPTTLSPLKIPEAEAEAKAEHSETDLHERRLRSALEFAQRDADKALRERKIRFEELSVMADKSSDLIAYFKEEFVKAKEVSDEKNASVRAAEKALIDFRSGINVAET